MHYAYECSAPNTVPRTADNSNRQAAKKSPTLLRKRCCENATPQRTTKKRSGSVGAKHPTDPATSSKFASHLKRIDRNTQSLCVTASGNEVSLNTSKLEVAKDMSLRSLVDCGASNNFVQRQSLDNRKLKYVEREIPPTRMTVRIATSASVTVMKRVVGISYTLK